MSFSSAKSDVVASPGPAECAAVTICALALLLTFSGSLGAAGAEPKVRLSVTPCSIEGLTVEESRAIHGFFHDLRDLLSAPGGIVLAGLASPSQTWNRRWEAPGAIRDFPGVTHILTSTARRGEEGLRLEFRLVDVGVRSAMWSLGDEVALDQLLGLRRRVVGGVIGALGIETTADDDTDAIGQGVYLDYLRARELLGRGELEAVAAARALLRDVTRQAPSFLPALLSRAESAVRLHQGSGVMGLDEAEGAIAAALRLDPRASEAFRIRGDIRSLRQGDGGENDSFEKTRAAYEEALALDPGNTRALAALGRLHLGRREFEEAAPLLKRAAQLDPANPALRTDYAWSLRTQGYVDGARRQHLEALAYAPQHEPTLIKLGYLERQAGRLDASAAWFERAAAATGHWYNFLRLAVTMNDLGDLEGMRRAIGAIGGSEFEDAVSEALELVFSGDYRRLRRLAESRLGAGEEDELWEDELWRPWAADAAIMIGDYERALQHYRVLAPELFGPAPVIKRGNLYPAPWVATALLERGDRAAAVRIADQIVEFFTTSEGEYDWIYNKHFRMAGHALAGRDELALQELRAAIDQGSRTIMFQRFVRLEEAPMYRALSDRPEFLEMIAELKAYNSEMRAALNEQRSHESSGRAEEEEAVRQAVLDYVAGIYEIDPSRIERSVHPELRKLGFSSSGSPGGGYGGPLAMTFEQLYDLAGRWNEKGRIDPDTAVKRVTVFEVLDKTASAKLTADWGVDYMHLAKYGDRWMIVNVVWQSPPPSTHPKGIER